VKLGVAVSALWLFNPSCDFLKGGGGFPGMTNPFLAAGANPLLFPQMMMGVQGQNMNNPLSLPLDMMSPELLAAQVRCHDNNAMLAIGPLPITLCP